MDTHKFKRKDEVHDMKTVRGLEDELATPQLWTLLGRLERNEISTRETCINDLHMKTNFISHKKKEYNINIYNKITHSYLHKAMTCPTILPFAKTVGILVQQANVSKHWLHDTSEKPLFGYQYN